LNQNEKKRRVATESLAYIEDGMVLGIGTGSTVDFLIESLPEHAHRLTAVISSSERSTVRLREIGIEVSELSNIGSVNLYIDGADEATERRHLIKGGGGALTREKILAGASQSFVCITDDSKLVDVLGSFPLPIEVIPMARSFVAHEIAGAGGRAIWREEFVTDNGNQILDVHGLDITDPTGLETQFNQIPGVVTVGIFAHRCADVLLVCDAEGVRTIK